MKKLLEAVRKHGEDELDELAAAVQTKSADQVEAHLQELRARKQRLARQRNSRVTNAPLENWLTVTHNHISEDVDYSFVITNVMEIIARFEPCDQFSWGKESKPNYHRIYAFLARILRGDTAAATADLTAADAAVIMAQLDSISNKLATIDTTLQTSFLRRFDATSPEFQANNNNTQACTKDNTFSLNPLSIPVPLLSLESMQRAEVNDKLESEELESPSHNLTPK